MINAKVIEDSISEEGQRITTLQLTYPRLVHSEFMTHRVFSRNASSSRAIPVNKILEMIRKEPAMPIHWGANQPGMQADNQLSLNDRYKAEVLWREAAQKASSIAERMVELGLHKQVSNRILEPFQHIHVVLTATEFSNWDDLRDHDAADPNIHELARQVKAARSGSIPKILEYGEWHLPYVTEHDWYLLRQAYRDDEGLQVELARKISAARCCRVSYLKHDGSVSSIEDDIDLCDKLAGSVPIHASPFEHQATPMPELQPRIYFNGGGDVEIKSFVPEGVSHIDMDGNAWSGNFMGWIQSRKLIEQAFASKF